MTGLLFPSGGVPSPVWSFCLADADSSGPSGSYIYLFIPKSKGWSYEVDPDVGIMSLPADNSIHINIGMVDRKINIRGAIIVGGTMSTLDTITEWLETSQAMSTGVMYAYIIKTAAGAPTVPIYKSFGGSGHTHHLKGCVKPWKIESKDGLLYMDLTFRGCKT